MSREEMDLLGWDACDVILVTGDAYVDHPSFGMAIVGRLLEAQGFRVGIIAQPDWQSTADFEALGRPTCSSASPPATWTRWSTATRRPEDPPRRCLHAPRRGRPAPGPQRHRLQPALREAFKDVPLVIGGIEASLRRIAHYDYWSGQGAPLDAARRRPTCCSTATPSAPWPRSPTASAAASRSSTSPTCAAPRSCATGCPTAGSRSTPPTWTRPAA
jgi:hypothetical protein